MICFTNLNFCKIETVFCFVNRRYGKSVFVQKFNKAWFDRYESPEIGNTGLVFLIYLLAKYGNTMRDSNFYAEKYFAAFPMLADQRVSRYGSLEFNQNYDCFFTRTINRGLVLFGLIDLETVKSETYRFNHLIKKSAAFDNVFSVTIQ